MVRPPPGPLLSVRLTDVGACRRLRNIYKRHCSPINCSALLYFLLFNRSKRNLGGWPISICSVTSIISNPFW